MNDPDPGSRTELGIVVLAAGMSSRFGSDDTPPKQLFEFEGESLVRRACRAAVGSRAQRSVVVLGHQGERIAAELKREPAIEIETVWNPDFEQGQASSVSCGVDHLVASSHAPPAGILFLPCDQPRVDSDFIDRLLNHFVEHLTDGAKPPILVPHAAGKPSSPVLFPKDLFAQLGELSGDQGGRQLLARYKERVVRFEVEDSTLLKDIDTLTDTA